MKKFLLLLVAFFAMTAAQAQTDKRSESISGTKAVKKEKTTTMDSKTTSGQTATTASKKAAKDAKKAKSATSSTNDEIISDPDTGNGTGNGGNAAVPGSGNGTNSGGAGSGVQTDIPGNGTPQK